MAMYWLNTTGERISLGPEVGRGGEANVYAITQRPDQLAKVHKRPHCDLEDKLVAMIDSPPPCLSLGGGYAELIWPLDIVRDADRGNACVGYTMRYVRNRLPLAVMANPATCPPQIDFSCRLRMAANLAWMVSEVHAAGHVLGDLHLHNVLGDLAGCLSVIDTDSFQFTSQGRVYRSTVARYGYLPAELLNVDLHTVDRLQEHDLFPLPVCIFQLLMDGNHPFSGKWLGIGPKPRLTERIKNGDWPYARPLPNNYRPGAFAPPFRVLHPLIQDLLSKAFQDGHRDATLRPKAAKWHQVLVDVENERAYVDKATRSFRKHPWRGPAPANGQSTGQGVVVSGHAKTLFHHIPLHLLRTLAMQCRRNAKRAVSVAILTAVLAGGFHLGGSRSPVTNRPRPQSRANRHTDQPLLKNQSTPQLWKTLRDLSLRTATRTSDGQLLTSRKEHEQ